MNFIKSDIKSDQEIQMEKIRSRNPNGENQIKKSKWRKSDQEIQMEKIR